MRTLLEAFVGEHYQVSGDPKRNSIAMAILMLLGTRLSDRHPVAGAPRSLEESVLNYGVKDLHRLRNAQQVDSYCFDLARRIQAFDRRLAAVTVRADMQDSSRNVAKGGGLDTLRLLINVRLEGEQSEMGFDTAIRLVDGNCDLRESGGD